MKVSHTTSNTRDNGKFKGLYCVSIFTILASIPRCGVVFGSVSVRRRLRLRQKQIFGGFQKYPWLCSRHQ